MKRARAQLARDAAWRRLHRPRRSWLRRTAGAIQRMLRNRSERVEPGEGDSACRLELLHLPYYQVAFAPVAGTTRAGVVALVGAYEGECLLVDPAALAWDELLEADAFVPTIEPAQAAEIARDALLRAVLSQPKWRGAGALEESPQVELIGYPFWVYYYQPRAGMLDAKLLDALTGRPTGSRAKVALLAALASRRRT